MTIPQANTFIPFLQTRKLRLRDVGYYALHSSPNSKSQNSTAASSSEHPPAQSPPPRGLNLPLVNASSSPLCLPQPRLGHQEALLFTLSLNSSVWEEAASVPSRTQVKGAVSGVSTLRTCGQSQESQAAPHTPPRDSAGTRMGCEVCEHGSDVSREDAGTGNAHTLLPANR